MSQPQDVMIRLLTPADREGWEALWRDYLDFYQSELDPAQFDYTFQRLSQPDYASMFGYVAEYEGKLVGLVNCINHDHGWHMQQVVYLQDLYVDDRARKLGIGQKLIEAVYAYADENNKANVYWTTQTSNHTARKLYDRIGTLTEFIKYSR
ncbi:GCN5-related N-acetyltransferase [Rahnella aceris]|jgi:GNAT superfamily N-acetyltransferase|uniref:GCN5-related N-acetyltransferase n=1 Tax=Rahnella sp. (strain Y9602) TaxID=2703885 RepID=A0A0H3F4M1_RAHSY|nr:GNAT family N-acetyltransferase [Rahnella aceris]ADW71692.1 GCN5-related N-acetyltransferase [Rahnella aceris]AFE56328.1 N-acetyltransferase GCN5 [Rahnella aquatilis HX2]MBU9860294.1 GNAT family N-acetyltransferase [Rahnella aceris]